MQNKKLRIALLVIFLILLSLPLIQMLIPFKKGKPLDGDFTFHEKPTLSDTSWFSGNYQSDFEKYVNDHIGFRPGLVRLHNQLMFSCFGIPQVQKVVVGKDNYLFSMEYLNAYTGVDFAGECSLRSKMEKIKILQDSLAAKNKTLILCLAPGKASFYPEFFPDKYASLITDSTNYKIVAKIHDEYGLNVVDFNKWFLEMKNNHSEECLLYPKYGIHWSQYGAMLAADSLARYVQEKSSIRTSHLEMYDMQQSTQMQSTDYDIANSMNLLFPLKTEPMCYPKYKWTENADKKPATLVIGDSYYWNLYYLEIGTHAFSGDNFWYYNELVYPASFYSHSNVKELNLYRQLQENDVFIIIATESNLGTIGWSFVEESIAALTSENHEQQQNEQTIQNKINEIRATPEWLKAVEEKAKTQGISLDSMLYLDAIWAIENP